MKTIIKLTSVLLLAFVPVSLPAAPAAGATHPEMWWTGTLSKVDVPNDAVTGEYWLGGRKFLISEHCAIVTLDHPKAALSDLQPGEKVWIHYQEVQGVRVADRISEKALQYEGRIGSIDRNTGTITMEEAPLYRPFVSPEAFQLASDCKVVRWNGKEGTFANLHPGDRISIEYEVPNGSRVAYSITEWTASFQGVPQAINLSADTVKARAASGEKHLIVGDDCQVILPGDTTGHWKDVAFDQKCRFIYEEVHGVKVLERIAPLESTGIAETASLR